jgi:hypothetical protein
LIEARVLAAGQIADFPGQQDPVVRLSPPAGTEEFVLVTTERPFVWLTSADMIDRGPFPRLAMDRATFQARLRAALASLPANQWQVQTLTITTHA